MNYDRTSRLALRLLSLTARALARGCDAIGRPDAGDDLRYFADYGGGRYRGAVFNAPVASPYAPAAGPRGRQ